MAEADTLALYPLTSPAGVAIPYDVFRPHGLLPVAITDAVSSDIAVPSGAELFVVYATTPCILRFDETNATAPVSGTFQAKALYIPADVHIIIDVNAEIEFTIIGTVAAATGFIFINTAVRWTDLQIAARLANT